MIPICLLLQLEGGRNFETFIASTFGYKPSSSTDTNKTKTAIKLRLESLSLFNKSEKEKFRLPLLPPSPPDSSCLVSSPHNCQQCWQQGRGLLQFSTHLLATARWAGAPPCSWWWGRLRWWWRLSPCRCLDGLTTGRLFLSLAPPALVVIERERERTYIFVFKSLSIFDIVVILSPLHLAPPSCSSTRLHWRWQGWPPP